MSLYSKIRCSMINRVLACMLGSLLVLVPLASCGAPAPLQFTSLDLGIPGQALNSPVTGPLPDNTVLHVRVTFKIDPNLLKQAQQQKVQPGQHSDLQGFANKLGIDDATYQKIKDFFSPQGIALNLSKLRTHLAIDGKASTFAKVLQTKFVQHNYNGRTFFAPATPPKVPTFLANSIDAINGLDNYSAPPVHALALPASMLAANSHPVQDCSPIDQTLLPRDVAGAYGYDQLWNRGLNGENMTVNLVEIDGSYKSDIQNYFDCINFKGKLSVVNVDGSPRQALGESTLDIQMVAGLARSVNIMLYQTDGNANDDPWTHVNDMLQRILDDNVNNANAGSVVSISLGAAEGDMTTDDVRAIDSSIQQLTRVEHMTVFIASGDCGAFASSSFGDLSVSFPASDPWAVSVGGTMMSVDGNHARVNEVVWADGSNRFSCKNRWGSGGGNSAMFQHPNWQAAPGVSNQFSRGARQVPDVAAAAFALAVFFNGQWGSVGGTSAAAPIWAAGMALVNEGLIKQKHSFGFSPQIFYTVDNQNGGSYYDVTRGNNLYYPATPGWDFSTGLGTPNLPMFYQTLANTLPNS
ncbi:MAG TPA: S53 family peptidase [Ktedonobacteraceae bacterium]|nr:S53 family peptidase [Ktedonobacteraceae bacterium]